MKGTGTRKNQTVLAGGGGDRKKKERKGLRTREKKVKMREKA